MNPHSPTFKLVFGILGNLIGVGVNLAPMKTFWYIYKKRNSHGFSGLPYLFSLVSALIWVLYGLPIVTKHAFLIITVNVISSLIQSFYLVVFFTFAEKKPKWQLMKVMGTCFVLVAILTVLTLTAVPPKWRTLTVGSICVVIGIITYASPLSVGSAVIRTKSVKYLPIVLCSFLLINSTIWTCYGIITTDIFVLIPNGVGVVFGVAQISLYGWYRNHKSKGKNAGAHELDGLPDTSKITDDKSCDKSAEKPKWGNGRHGDPHDKSCDKWEERSLRVNGKHGDPHDKAFDKGEEKSVRGTGKHGDPHDKAFDKSEEKSVRGNGNYLDAYEKYFDKSEEKSVRGNGKLPPTARGYYENSLSPSLPFHDSPAGVVVTVHASPGVVVTVHASPGGCSDCDV